MYQLYSLSHISNFLTDHTEDILVLGNFLSLLKCCSARQGSGLETLCSHYAVHWAKTVRLCRCPNLPWCKIPASAELRKKSMLFHVHMRRRKKIQIQTS